MKQHKIPDVPLAVCSAEQKIAYNLAFRIDINQGNQYRAFWSTEEKVPKSVSDYSHSILTASTLKWN